MFPLLKANKAWLGSGMGRWISGFIVPPDYELYGTEARLNEQGQRIVSTNNALWLTNLDHGRRHQPLDLMTLEDNIRYESPEMLLEPDYFGELDELGGRVVLVLYDSPEEIRNARRRILSHVGADLFGGPVIQFVKHTAATRLDMETAD